MRAMPRLRSPVAIAGMACFPRVLTMLVVLWCDFLGDDLHDVLNLRVRNL